MEVWKIWQTDPEEEEPRLVRSLLDVELCAFPLTPGWISPKRPISDPYALRTRGRRETTLTLRRSKDSPNTSSLRQLCTPSSLAPR